MGEAEAIEQTRENLEIAEEHEAQRSERIQVKWCLRISDPTGAQKICIGTLFMGGMFGV